MSAVLATDDGSRQGMGRGLLCSLLLHAMLAVALWRAPWPAAAPRPVFLAVPIDLVSLGDITSSPAATQKAELPQQKARESAERPERTAVPKPLVAEPVAEDPLSRKLQRLAQAQQPERKLPPSPTIQDGAGQSNVTASNAPGRNNGAASYGIKDYLRQQIERRWVLPPGALQRNDWVVRLHLQIKEDGQVLSAEIVDDARLSEDRGYREFAFSARNAALLSSPLLLPRQFAELASDVVLEFNPRQVQQ